MLRPPTAATAMKLGPCEMRALAASETRRRRLLPKVVPPSGGEGFLHVTCC
jgi:hypothetical protein